MARYEYYIRDHLGNIRLTYSDLNADGLITTPNEILEEMHYYAYGMMMEGAWMGSSGQYGYNGIEYENFLDLEMNLATYRGLDPALGRWGQVDPKAEVTFPLTPYGSMNNNPISFTDPDGDIAWIAPLAMAMLKGAAIGVATNGIMNITNQQNFFNGAGKAALWGAVGGGIAHGIGVGAQAMANAGANKVQVGLAQAGAHGLSGGIQSWAQGGSFGSGFLSGGVSSGIGSLSSGWSSEAQMLSGIAGGGLASLAGGGNFWDGVKMGAITVGLNHLEHSVLGIANGDPITPEEKKEILEYWAGEYLASRITQNQYLNVYYLIEEGSWALVKNVIKNHKSDIAMAVIPGGRIVKSGMSYKEIVKILKKNGWTFVRNGKGSHRIWQSPSGNQLPIPDHGSKSISKGIINQINKID